MHLKTLTLLTPLRGELRKISFPPHSAREFALNLSTKKRGVRILKESAVSGRNRLGKRGGRETR